MNGLATVVRHGRAVPWLPCGTRRQLRLVDAPLQTARATQHWLRQQPTRDGALHRADDTTVRAGQVHELAAAFRATAPVLLDIVDRLVAAVPAARRHPADGAIMVTVDLVAAARGVRHAADILVTIDHLSRPAGSTTSLALPAQTPRLVSWIADEIAGQARGRPPTAYPASQPPSPQCALLRAATYDGGSPPLHAFHHRGLTAWQTTAIRASGVTAALAAQPGATLEQLRSRLVKPRLELLGDLGDLIELGAVFGIGHRWYPYDIAVLALDDAPAARRGCTCPATASSAAA